MSTDSSKAEPRPAEDVFESDDDTSLAAGDLSVPNEVPATFSKPHPSVVIGVDTATVRSQSQSQPATEPHEVVEMRSGKSTPGGAAGDAFSFSASEHSNRNSGSHMSKMRSSSGESALPSPVLPSSEDQNFNVSSLVVNTPVPLLGHHSRSESMISTEMASLDSSNTPTNLSKRVSLKAQKKFYRTAKRRATREVMSTLKDPSVVVMADHLKVRGIMKGWTKLWCVLKPGLFILYKSQKQKSSHWVGTILLNTTELIERPSKKDGFCFKLFHPLDQSIWATRGPGNESIGAFTQPLPYSFLIFRAPSEGAGRTWMDALELALRCSSVLLKTMNKDKEPCGSNGTGGDSEGLCDDVIDLNESDREKHFNELQETGQKTDNQSDTESSSIESDVEGVEDAVPVETPYVTAPVEEISLSGEELSEELADENKGIIWHLMKQVRPGMDLSKVVLPTFILEPRSLLEKFSDYYYHADYLAKAAVQEDAFTRLKYIVKWYISGFYKKPKGLKKPYNPILGETYRCYWKHPTTGSRTFYIAEQISHHPPVSAFYVTNRKEGFSIACTVLAKSKFYGNSVSAVMDANGLLTLLRLGEDYRVTMPYAHAKGIIVGTLTMELGGKVSIECEKTGYRADLEFKLKPFMGSSDSTSKIVGKLKLGGETLATLEGHWDTEVFIKDKLTGASESFWKVNQNVVSSRLPKYIVPMEYQLPTESERLWTHCSAALKQVDQEKATREKGLLEENQRREAKERKVLGQTWVPHYFELDQSSGSWLYKYSDLRPWDPVNDIMQYEYNYHIQTKARHKMALVKQMSLVNISANTIEPVSGGRPSTGHRSLRSPTGVRSTHRARPGGISSSPSQSSDLEQEFQAKESLDQARELPQKQVSLDAPATQPVVEGHQGRLIIEQLERLQLSMAQLRASYQQGVFLQPRDWLILLIVLLFQAFFQWVFK